MFFTRWRKPLSSAVFWNCIWNGTAWTRRCGSGIGNSGRGCWAAHWNEPIMNGQLRRWDSCAPNGGRSMKIIGRWRMPY